MTSKILKISPNESIRDLLVSNNFPIDQIAKISVTAIEGISVKISDEYHGVCARGCLGCSANAIHPTGISQPINILTPQLLKGLLSFVKKLKSEGTHILSLKRLNLFSGSNELEHPHCFELRETLSNYFKETYGTYLGSISSDIVFHISPSITFKRNLVKLLKHPQLFDNICIAIDEQMPMDNSHQYAEYLENLKWVWQILNPAIQGELLHIRRQYERQPRVIANFLLPSIENGLKTNYLTIFPGGLFKATSYEELEKRYVEPFVGNLMYLKEPIPEEHVFTTSVASLSKIDNSRIYVSNAVFEPVGRATSYLACKNIFPKDSFFSPIIRIKIYPTNDYSFAFQACLAPNPYSDGSIDWDYIQRPEWVSILKSFIIDVSKLMEV